jgi:hypothetical protein
LENKWCIDDKNLTTLSRLFIHELFSGLEHDLLKIQKKLNNPLNFINGKYVTKIMTVQLSINDVMFKNKVE